MSLNLITGYSGTSHITSASDGCTNAGLYGKGKYVLNIAEKFGAEIISNNLIRIKSGYAINQGRKIELAINDYEEVEIDNGLQGVKRCDLIVIHYEKNLTTGIETGSVKVIKGTSGDIYSDPAYTSGDIINGANEDDFLLYRVKINGLSIEAVEPLFTVTESLMTLLDNMQENSKKLMGEADISKIGDGTVKGAIGALADSDKEINQSLSSKVDTTDSRLSDARDPKAHTHDDRYYTESEINLKVNPLYNIGRGDTVGKIYKYDDSTHTVGITWKEYSTSYAPIPRFVFDGKQTFDVIPNNPGTNNYKIINCWISVQNGGTFRLNFIIYIDGTYYTRYINLS